MTESIPDRSFRINTQVLQKLANEVSFEVFPTLIDVFLKELDTRLTSIKTLPFKGNEQHMRIQVHSIKSCARTFGATMLADKAAQIEQLLDSGSSQIDAMVDEQIKQMQAIHPALKQAYLHYRTTLSAQ